MTKPEQAAPRFSLVIPARNEAKLLPRLLDTVETARGCYRGGRESVEAIVADNVSSDGTDEIARSRGCLVARVEKRNIAAVRNGGAAIARGEVLAFVDADCRIHPETFNAIDDALAGGRVIAGATGVRLERWSAGLVATYLLMIPFIWATAMDTGVVFCRRRDFETIGGYDESRAYAEDVQFLWRLRRLGQRRGERLARVTRAKAIASVRKFDRYGEWHYLIGFARSACYLLFSRSKLDAWAQDYWYGDHR